MSVSSAAIITNAIILLVLSTGCGSHQSHQSPESFRSAENGAIHRIQVVGMDPDFEAFLGATATVGR